jgi:hypothetical protein
MNAILGHRDLQGLRRWSLVTKDAHGLYQQFGFRAVAKPQTYMEIINPQIYKGERRRKRPAGSNRPLNKHK